VKSKGDKRGMGKHFIETVVAYFKLSVLTLFKLCYIAELSHSAADMMIVITVDGSYIGNRID
jgi:hypothetical protein